MTTKKPATKTAASKKPAVKTPAKKTSEVKTPAVKRLKVASAATMAMADQQVERLKKGAGRIVMPELKTKVAGEKAKADGAPSKMTVATELYQKHIKEGRKVVMAAFIEKAGLTKAGANTYYANIKKKLAA